MLLLILTLTISLGGLVAIELGQAARPRECPARPREYTRPREYADRPREYTARPNEYTTWNDDAERRLLRLHPGSSSRW